MIAKGNTLRAGSTSGHYLAKHLTKTADDDGCQQTVTIGQLHRVSGAGSSDYDKVYQALRDHEAGLAHSRQCQNPIWHCNLSPDQPMSPAQWARAWQVYEEAHGFTGHPFIGVIHDKVGRERHEHRAYSRRTAAGTALHMGHSKYRDEAACKILEFEFGHQFTPVLTRHVPQVGRILRELGRADVAAWFEERAAQKPATDALLNRDEHQQQRRTGIKAGEVRAIAHQAWVASDNLASFQAALAREGLSLARGDRAKLIIIDAAGGRHELARVIAAARKAAGLPADKRLAREEIAGRLGGLDLETLPTAVEAAAALAGGEATEPTADPLDVLSRSSCVWSEQALWGACRRIARTPESGVQLYQHTLGRADLITLSMDPRRYTSKVLAEAEANLIRLSLAAQGDRRHGLAADRVAKWLGEFRDELRGRQGGFDLSLEQIKGVRHLVEGAAIVALKGAAGSGKSTTLEAVRRLLQREGYQIEGVALAGKAAAGLAEASGIPATTLDAWLIRFDRQAAYASRNLEATWSVMGKRLTLRGGLIGTLDWVKGRAGTERRAWYESARRELVTAESLADLSGEVRGWVEERIARVVKGRVDGKTVLVLDEAGMVSHSKLEAVLQRARGGC
ncbi:MAG: AAA family ATPase [Rhodospirillaceae bacterium]